MAQEADHAGGTAISRREGVASHVGPAFDDIRRAARAVVRHRHGPRYVAHFTGTVWDFEVDLLGGAAQRLRSSYRQAGRQLSGTVARVDEELRAAATGALIRTVLHTDRGAYYCNSIVPGSLVVSAVSDRLSDSETEVPLAERPTVLDCDEMMSTLVTDVRKKLSLGTQNPGGYESKPVTTPSWVDMPAPNVYRDPDADERTVSAIEGELAAAVDTADLHYVALCRDSSIMVSADCLDHRYVSKFFTQISVSARHTFYRTFNRGLGLLASRFARMTGVTVGTRLLRMVLDVEQGAVYYYRLGPGEYLAGVTLDQSRVHDADLKMSTLAIACKLR